MTIQEAQNLLQSASQVGTLAGYSFGMAFAGAVEKLENEQKRVEKLHKKSEAFEKYEKEEQELLVKFTEKEADDKTPKIKWYLDKAGNKQGDYVFDKEKEDERFLALAELRKKYKKEIDEQKKKEDNYREALKSESKFKKVSLKEELMPGNPEGKYPDEKITGMQIFITRKLIELKK